MKEIMTLEELAAYLRVSERTVYDWANKGEIPGGKIGTSWRFRRIDIENWVNQKLSPRIHPDAPSAPPISAFLKPQRCVLLDCKSKNEALNRLIDLCTDIPGLTNRTELAEAVFNREKLMSTGIGLSIAVPHARLNSINEIQMAFAVSKTGITDYESLDGVPVRLIVLIIAGRNQHTAYIQTLSRISRLLKNEIIRERLYNCKDDQAIYDILVEGDMSA
ncbi:MAG TPA: helix-turn-helix domain-containing protein [Candidatus Marinimicrobia bacterium]|nr:helix-turn-helix domain-containing protein [Candidatus Neomarinimicrobiota bacterium]